MHDAALAEQQERSEQRRTQEPAELHAANRTTLHHPLLTLLDHISAMFQRMGQCP
jgi:hypothetical protein